MTNFSRTSCLLFLALLFPCLLFARPKANTQSFRVAPSYFPNKGQVSDKSETYPLHAGRNQIEIDRSSWPAGLYFWTARQGPRSTQGKLMLHTY